MQQNLPPGPRVPALLQTLAAWVRPTAFIDRCRKRYGNPFVIRGVGQPPLVIVSDPDAIREIFLAPPDVLHPGEGARILEPLVGRHSVILLDGDAHMQQRKLLLPAFHGERMQRMAGVMAELTEQELSRWPRGEPIQLHSRLQRLTLEIILRTVFGLKRGAQLDALRDQLTRTLAFAENPLSFLPPPPPRIARFTPMARFERNRAATDRLIAQLIEERRAHRDAHAEPEDDVLGMLLAATHEDGSPMSAQELRDELVTALVAGHETTASQLAWAFERIARAPSVQGRLQAEIDAGAGEDYLTATINEVLRLRPVLPHAEPRVVKRPVTIGGIEYQPGVALMASAHLLHRDPELYPQPREFRPERFLGEQPGTYTWIPFGGGRRRCVGASFALLEMRIAIRSVLARCDVAPATVRGERPRRRNIAISPSDGGRVVLGERAPRAVRAPAPAQRQLAPA